MKEQDKIIEELKGKSLDYCEGYLKALQSQKENETEFIRLLRKEIGNISVRKGIYYDKPWTILRKVIDIINKLEKNNDIKRKR